MPISTLLPRTAMAIALAAVLCLTTSTSGQTTTSDSQATQEALWLTEYWKAFDETLALADQLKSPENRFFVKTELLPAQYWRDKKMGQALAKQIIGELRQRHQSHGQDPENPFTGFGFYRVTIERLIRVDPAFALTLLKQTKWDFTRPGESSESVHEALQERAAKAISDLEERRKTRPPANPSITREDQLKRHGEGLKRLEGARNKLATITDLNLRMMTLVYWGWSSRKDFPRESRQLLLEAAETDPLFSPDTDIEFEKILADLQSEIQIERAHLTDKLEDRISEFRKKAEKELQWMTYYARSDSPQASRRIANYATHLNQLYDMQPRWSGITDEVSGEYRLSRLNEEKEFRVTLCRFRVPSINPGLAIADRFTRPEIRVWLRMAILVGPEPNQRM